MNEGAREANEEIYQWEIKNKLDRIINLFEMVTGRFDPVCRKCGDPLTLEELVCGDCKTKQIMYNGGRYEQKQTTIENIHDLRFYNLRLYLGDGGN